MRRLQVSLAILSVGLITTIFCGRAPSGSVPNAPQFEYCRVEVSNGGWGISYEAKGMVEITNVAPKQLSAGALFKQITGQQMPDVKTTSLDIELINAMGAQGWEVIQASSQRDGWMTFLLKRHN